MRRVGGEQDDREDRERERRRIEDVHAAAVPLPAHERLAGKAERDQGKLQGEPVVLEPEKQVGAEDDREGAKPQAVFLAPRPRQEHVERVGKQELADEQRQEVVDRRPVPPPIGVHGELTAALNVMLRARRHEAQVRRTARANRQHRVPGQQQRGRSPERPCERLALPQPGQQGECEEARREDEGRGKTLNSPDDALYTTGQPWATPGKGPADAAHCEIDRRPPVATF